jgi:hypothetical protein
LVPFAPVARLLLECLVSSSRLLGLCRFFHGSPLLVPLVVTYRIVPHPVPRVPRSYNVRTTSVPLLVPWTTIDFASWFRRIYRASRWVPHHLECLFIVRLGCSVQNCFSLHDPYRYKCSHYCLRVNCSCVHALCNLDVVLYNTYTLSTVMCCRYPVQTANKCNWNTTNST